MIQFVNLTVAQQRWVSMVQHFFPEIYARGNITHKELMKAHTKFLELRETDKKYKVGWPIWLIMNNATSRGVYKIPMVADTEKETNDSPHFADYETSLKEFGVV